MTNKQELGSQTAKNGFKNEKDIVQKFNNWKNDNEAQHWLGLMEYSLNEIEYVKAIILSGYKADIQVQITIKLKEAIDAENIQVKLVSNSKGFNQIDKRWIDKYTEMWQIPNNISNLLKQYTGEVLPLISNPKDKRRTFANEFSSENQKSILNWLINNKTLIISDLLKGRGKFSAEWMLVAQKADNSARWVLKPMNYCLNFFGNGEIEITKRGNFKIGKITMQRKGGDGGRKTAQMLQFKINPAELFID
ncbi:MAG: type II restriction endonuclease [Flavobacterium sp.]|nr:MAG: type II restriction endonuclease [Flavobacterium sp.]